MDEFCREKGIKREYSVARTPQQNGVAERKNRTLIEAARTMLADSKLPTTFWAEVVSTACYVSLLDYSLNSKALGSTTLEPEKFQENLHVGFLENKPMIEGNGPKWLFDLDSLTQSMNYVNHPGKEVNTGSRDVSTALPESLNMLSWKTLYQNEFIKLLEIPAMGRSNAGGTSSVQTANGLDSCRFYLRPSCLGQIDDVGICMSTCQDFEDTDHPDKVIVFVQMEISADVDEHLYRSMIGSLMYLTASRPDIMFVLLTRIVSMAGATQDREVNNWRCSLDPKPTAGLWICLDMQRNQLQQHTRSYPVPSLSMKVFNNMKRPTKGFSGQEVALFPTMLDVTEPSTSPSRITSSPSPSPDTSPSHSLEPSTQHSPDNTTAAASQTITNTSITWSRTPFSYTP
ncbi:putative ribonuclease H-like domain-containing protein [Tanacetum coccineum]